MPVVYAPPSIPRSNSWKPVRGSARPAVALRDAAATAVSRFGPGLILRGFDGIADWRPPAADPAVDGPSPRVS
ncbi:hypothetical protein ACF09L_30120 [Streptomyces sp. NPDC014779]|uniref:hypothetical protein n=1 Tax=unclassified Streptomyces TaxID=2593676 RepID=UPI0036FF86CE